MAKKTLLVGSVLAAALLAGCNSNGGNAVAAGTSASSSSSTGATSSNTSSADPTTGMTEERDVPSATPDETTEESDETSPDTDADDTGSVEPAALDADSTVWFGTMCTGLTGAVTGMMGAMGGMMSTDGSDPAATRTTIATSFQTAADSFNQTAQALTGLPAPGIDNGDEFASKAIEAFSSVGSTLSTAVQDLAAAPVTDQASLEAALDAFQTQTDTAMAGIEGNLSGFQDDFTPEITAAVEALPECQILSGS